MKISLSIIAPILSCYVLFDHVFCQDKKEESIFVKPGAGTLSVEHVVNGYKCQFTYAAQGGTHEEWAFSLEMLDGGAAVMCAVERHSSSYLYFEHFKMELTGPGVAITEVELKASNRDNKYLESSEFEKAKNSVSSSSSFKNHVEKIAVYAPLPRDDL